MRFENSHLLWLLLVIPPLLALFFWWALRTREKLLAQFIHSRLLAGLTVGVSPARLKIRFALVILATVFLVLAIARPQRGFELQEVAQRGLDIIVAVDTSKSMLATDISPNRLTRAKLAALELMQKAATDRLGLVAFAGDAFLECPLTIDNTAFQQSVQGLDVNTIPQGGTSLGSAITTALDAFKEKDHYKALVLFTDGEDNDTGALEAAQAAKAAGLKIFTVGIGTTEGDLLNPNLVRDEQGNAVKSHLNEQLLQQIAATTEGFYMPLRGANVIDSIYDRGIAPMPKAEGREKLVRRYHEQFQWPLAVASLLLLAELFFPERKTEKRKTTATATAPGVATLLLCVLLGLTASASASPADAMRAYNSGNYTNALQEFERLSLIYTNDLRLVFNAGAAAYRGTNFDEAVKDFKWVTLSPDLKLQQSAYYNLGNTQYRMGENAKDLDGLQDNWETAIKSYERAVELDKKDTNAVYNLNFVKNGVAQINQLREYLRRARLGASEAVRQRNYHQALGIMEPLTKTPVAKQVEDYIKKLKDIDAIATPQQPQQP